MKKINHPDIHNINREQQTKTLIGKTTRKKGEVMIANNRSAQKKPIQN